jgi:hypothetical protein
LNGLRDVHGDGDINTSLDEAVDCHWDWHVNLALNVHGGWGLNHFGHWVGHKLLLSEDLLGSNCNCLLSNCEGREGWLSNGDCGEGLLSNCNVLVGRLGESSEMWAGSDDCGGERRDDSRLVGKGGCCEGSRVGTADDGPAKESTIHHSVSSIQSCCRGTDS